MGMQKRDTRERILKEAVIIFSNKGYEGASMEEIAKKISINKATIYHHFKGKKEILDTIIENLIQETAAFRRQMAADALKAGTDNINEIVKNQADLRYNFLKEKTDVFSILLADAIKKGDKDNYLFKYLDSTLNLVMKDETERRLQEKYKMREILQKPEAFISSIFLGVLPMILFLIISEKFAGYYNLELNETEQIYKNLMVEIADFLRKKFV